MQPLTANINPGTRPAPIDRRTTAGTDAEVEALSARLAANTSLSVADFRAMARTMGVQKLRELAAMPGAQGNRTTPTEAVRLTQSFNSAEEAAAWLDQFMSEFSGYSMNAMIKAQDTTEADLLRLASQVSAAVRGAQPATLAALGEEKLQELLASLKAQ